MPAGQFTAQPIHVRKGNSCPQDNSCVKRNSYTSSGFAHAAPPSPQGEGNDRRLFLKKKLQDRGDEVITFADELRLRRVVVDAPCGPLLPFTAL